MKNIAGENTLILRAGEEYTEKKIVYTQHLIEGSFMESREKGSNKRAINKVVSIVDNG